LTAAVPGDIFSSSGKTHYHQRSAMTIHHKELQVAYDEMMAQQCLNVILQSCRTVSHTSLRDKKRVIRVKCSCQKSYSVNLELRKIYRKSTSLRGKHINHSQQDNRNIRISGKIIVRDVSMGTALVLKQSASAQLKKMMKLR